MLSVLFEPLGITIPAEVRAVKAQGKPRLRKIDKDNRKKFHLPQLVMAVARLPEPAREDLSHRVSFPLENKSFVMDSMDFEIIEDDGITATLAPLRVTILHSDLVIDLQDRFMALAQDMKNIKTISEKHPALANAIQVFDNLIAQAKNSTEIRRATDKIISLQAEIFGMTNAGSATKLEAVNSLPETDLEEDIRGKEGRLLTRIHAYKERDRDFARRAKKYYRAKNGGQLVCEACGLKAIGFYGPTGERCIEAHHTVPIEQLQPDSVTTVDQMAMVCASCHRMVHSKTTCLTIAEVRQIIETAAVASAG